MARLSDRDAASWDGLAARVAGPLEERLDVRVLGNRVELRPGGGWRLRRLGRALATARRAAAALASASPLVLRTDIRSFYPSVHPAIVHDSVQGLADRDDARLMSGLLDGWGSEGYPGLPIGPRASAVLANAVLRPADRELSDVPFLRWVDDYLIGVRDPSYAAEVLERLDTSLARLELRRAPEKTALFDGGRAVRWPGGFGGATGRSC